MLGTPRGAHPSLKTGERASTGLLVQPLEEFKGGSLSSQDCLCPGNLEGCLAGWLLWWRHQQEL